MPPARPRPPTLRHRWPRREHAAMLGVPPLVIEPREAGGKVLEAYREIAGERKLASATSSSRPASALTPCEAWSRSTTRSSSRTTTPDHTPAARDDRRGRLDTGTSRSGAQSTSWASQLRFCGPYSGQEDARAAGREDRNHSLAISPTGERDDEAHGGDL
jgi:hypothetical protein